MAICRVRCQLCMYLYKYFPTTGITMCGMGWQFWLTVHTWTRNRTGPTAATNSLRWHLLISHAWIVTPEDTEFRYKEHMSNHLQFFVLKRTRAWFLVKMLASFFSLFEAGTEERFSARICISVCVKSTWLGTHIYVVFLMHFTLFLGSIACHVHWFLSWLPCWFTSVSNEIHAWCPSIIVLCR